MSILETLDTYIKEDARVADELAIYYEDLTEDGRKKILDALTKSDDLLDIYGDPKQKESVESALFGVEGVKEPVQLFLIDGDTIRTNIGKV